MSEIQSTKPEIEMSDLSVSIEMKKSIIKLAGPRLPEDNRESFIARGAYHAGISFRQAKTFFYKESANPRSKAVEQVRAAIARNNRLIEEAASNEIKSLRNRLARLESVIASLASNPNGAAVRVDGGRAALDRQEDSPVDCGG